MLPTIFCTAFIYFSPSGHDVRWGEELGLPSHISLVQVSRGSVGGETM